MSDPIADALPWHVGCTVHSGRTVQQAGAMRVRIGINGFGRIWRLVLRACLGHEDLEVAAVNDIADAVTFATSSSTVRCTAPWRRT